MPDPRRLPLLDPAYGHASILVRGDLAVGPHQDGGNDADQDERVDDHDDRPNDTFGRTKLLVDPKQRQTQESRDQKQDCQDRGLALHEFRR